MTHPQGSPGTPVGSFAKQVFSLMASGLWRGVKSSPSGAAGEASSCRTPIWGWLGNPPYTLHRS